MGPTPGAALALAVILLCHGFAACLDNGLARTPPLGFNTWNAFNANISEGLVKDIADRMVSLGLRDAGYQYLIVDDGWMAGERGTDGRLVADPAKFPSGMKALGDYIHSKGLKFGIYGDAGLFTCLLLPGSRGYEQRDAETWAEWGVDYLKYDNCWAEPDDPPLVRYTAMRDALNRTGRPILYSACEWGMDQPWLWPTGVAHSWRTTTDIERSWESVLGILDNSVGLARFARPAGWNDLDMLQVGVADLTPSQQRAHFALWALLKSPLLLGADLRSMAPSTLALFKAKELLAVNQDPLGVAGELVWKQGPREVYAAPLAGGARAVVLFNRHSIFAWQSPDTYPPVNITVLWEQLGLDPGFKAVVRDLYAEKDLGEFAGSFTATVSVHDVAALRITPRDGAAAAAEEWRPWEPAGRGVFALYPEN